MKKFIVCGGRDYADFLQMDRCLSALHEQVGISMIIEGNANGADKMAGDWAEVHGILVYVFIANRSSHGKAAGLIRNKQMLEMKPDGVVAFPGGKGTQHMIQISKEVGIPVWEIQPDHRFFE